jgi:hypothetical protein
MIRLFWPLVILGLLLAGCTMEGKAGDTTAAPVDLPAQFAEVQRTQQVTLDLWDRIIFGETVSCEEIISVPAALDLSDQQRASYPQADIFQAQINAALESLRESIRLWDEECANSRPSVPLSVAKQGRAAALAAGDPLTVASVILASWGS